MLLDEPRVVPHEAGRAAGYEPEQPLDIFQEKLEPPVVETKDLLPDLRALPPDEEVARRDFVDYLQNASTSWPKVERDIFALHFLDGFDVDEVAMIEGLKPSEVERHIQTLRSRVREMIESARGPSKADDDGRIDAVLAMRDGRDLKHRIRLGQRCSSRCARRTSFRRATARAGQRSLR